MSAGPSTSSELRLANALDAHPDGILVIDEKGVVRYANPAAAEAFESTLQGIVGRQFSLKIASGGRAELRGTGGRILRARCVPAQWNAQPARLVCLSDITELRRAEEQLREQIPRIDTAAGSSAVDLDLLGTVTDALGALSEAADRLHRRLRDTPALLVRQAADVLAEHRPALVSAYAAEPELAMLPDLLDEVAVELGTDLPAATEAADHLRRALKRLHGRIRHAYDRAR